jgi:DNA-directed RNA polymerase subunit E'/Rpb7
MKAIIKLVTISEDYFSLKQTEIIWTTENNKKDFLEDDNVELKINKIIV